MLRPLSVVVPLLLAAGMAGAEEIPQSALDSDYAECVRTCTSTTDETRCTSYCACALQGVQERFDLEEYRILTEALMARQSGESGSIAKLKGIMSSCAAELPN